ncbi:hypothetical protein [Streptomyces sp. NPDC096324]|uniref:hypothetical protein n=1 Tax=Streptomyces sp. NPDC096324 TaxID=3366085 RepID=UPI0037F46121
MLGYPTKRIARYMGLDTRTVDYHGRKGKERLRIQLGLPAPAGRACALRGRHPNEPWQGVWPALRRRSRRDGVQRSSVSCCRIQAQARGLNREFPFQRSSHRAQVGAHGLAYGAGRDRDAVQPQQHTQDIGILCVLAPAQETHQLPFRAGRVQPHRPATSVRPTLGAGEQTSCTGTEILEHPLAYTEPGCRCGPQQIGALDTCRVDTHGEIVAL